MSKILSSFATSPYWPILKWAMMTMCIFWTLVYQLSQKGSEMAGFVYANF
jgi:hypothetical protein